MNYQYTGPGLAEGWQPSDTAFRRSLQTHRERTDRQHVNLMAQWRRLFQLTLVLAYSLSVRSSFT